MNNWFPLFNLLIAQKKLKDNDVDEKPNELLLGLFPGFQGNPVPQLLMTNAVVNNAITAKEKDTVVAQKAVVDRANTELVATKAELTKANTDLGEAAVSLVKSSLTLNDKNEVIEDTPAAKAVFEIATKKPAIRKLFLDSDVSEPIKQFVRKTPNLDVVVSRGAVPTTISAEDLLNIIASAVVPAVKTNTPARKPTS